MPASVRELGARFWPDGRIAGQIRSIAAFAGCQQSTPGAL
jgi:hypothetical protein